MTQVQRAPEIHFSDPDLDIYTDFFGSLALRFAEIADSRACQRFGKQALIHPTDIELSPYLNEYKRNRAEVVVDAWHEATGIGSSSELQRHSFIATVVIPSRGDIALFGQDEDGGGSGVFLSDGEWDVLRSVFARTAQKSARH